jgi:hypothetical protein
MKFIASVTVALTIGIIFLLPIRVQAFDINQPGSNSGSNSVCSGSGASTSYCSDTSGGGQNDIYGPTGLITDTINIISILAGVISVFVLMIGGFRFIVSSGDPSAVAGARNMIIFALVGIVIIGFAQIILRFVISKF